MRVEDNLIKATYHAVCVGIRHILEELILMVQEIWQGIFWDRVSRAWHEPSKDIPKLELPLHPVPNTYPKQFKATPWPQALDNAWGASFPSSNDNSLSPETEPNENVTSLHAVTLGNNEKGFFRLIADSAEVVKKDLRGQSPAYWAAYHGNLRMLMRLKAYGANLHEKDFRGKTPLRAAVKYAHEDIIEFLASHQVDLNEVDGRGITPLHLAAFHGHFSVYQKLIFLGADQTIKDPLGRTADDILKMKYAETYHHRWLIGRLFSSPTPPTLSLGAWKIENLKTRAITHSGS